MPKQTELFLPTDTRLSAQVTFANADGTNLKDVISAGTDGSRVVMISIASSDGTARDLLYYLSDAASSDTTPSTGDRLIGHVDIPANAGFDGTVNAVNGLNTTNLPVFRADVAGNRFFSLPAGTKLRMAAKVAVTASASVWVSVVAEDY